MARVNYQRDKRQKDLARQAKQEQKRLRRQNKDHAGTTPEGTEPDAAEVESADGAEPAATEEP